MQGNSSPIIISKIRVEPINVFMVTLPALPSVTSPIISESSAKGCFRSKQSKVMT